MNLRSGNGFGGRAACVAYQTDRLGLGAMTPATGAPALILGASHIGGAAAMIDDG